MSFYCTICWLNSESRSVCLARVLAGPACDHESLGHLHRAGPVAAEMCHYMPNHSSMLAFLFNQKSGLQLVACLEAFQLAALQTCILLLLIHLEQRICGVPVSAAADDLLNNG